MIIRNSKVNEFVTKAGLEISSPQQRLIIGLTALVTQPVIDLSNKKADEETRVLSACRSLGKIIAATTSGVIVREACISLAKNKATTNLLKNVIKDTEKLTEHNIRKFSNFMGSAGALVVMLFTNFLWDAPVTQKLTNFFYKHVSNKKETE